LGGSGQGQDILDVVGDSFLTQKVLAPTRGDNILDLVICSDSGIVENLVVGYLVANINFNLLEFDIVLGGQQSGQQQEFFCYYKGNYSNIKKEIVNDWWVTILGTCMVEKGWGLFKKRLQLLKDIWVLRVRGKDLECKHKTQKWMN